MEESGRRAWRPKGHWLSFAHAAQSIDGDMQDSRLALRIKHWISYARATQPTDNDTEETRQALRREHWSSYAQAVKPFDGRCFPFVLESELRTKVGELLGIRIFTEPSPSEKSAVKDWRRRAERQVRRRIADFSYQNARSPYLSCVVAGLFLLVKPFVWFCSVVPWITGLFYLAPALSTRLNDMRSSHQNHRRSEHRMLRIAELRNAIIEFAGPYAQIQACGVSKSWRSSALVAIRDSTELFSTLSCKPIEHGRPINERVVAPLQPSPEEIVQFERHVKNQLAQRLFGRHKPKYFPARLALARGLSPLLQQLLADYERASWHTHWLQGLLTEPPRRSRCWFDLSQLSINPYLDALLARNDQIKHRLGRWEITLRPSSSPRLSPSRKTLVLNDDIASKEVLDSIGTMHVTNPPCRALGLYHNDPRGGVAGRTKLLVRVENVDGVRICEFLPALQDAASTTHEAWLANAHGLADDIKRSHCIDDIWNIPGAPTIHVYLDHHRMSDNVGAQTPRVNFARYTQMKTEPDRRSREMAWISEDLLESAGAIVDRDPIDWNS